MKKDGFKSKKLRRGKLKGVGVFEGIYLKTVGRIDGTRNLPRACKDGSWTSPHLDREGRSYEELCGRIWGELQIKNEEKYIRIGELMDTIPYKKRQLNSVENDLSMISHEDDISRRKGESKLTDAQVAVRRNRERDTRLSPYKNHVNSLRVNVTAEVNELSNLRNRILEEDNSTRMICLRVREHLFQRIDVYWNAALKRHPERDKMPVTPSIELGLCNAESTYLNLHKELMQKANMFENNN